MKKPNALKNRKLIYLSLFLLLAVVCFLFYRNSLKTYTSQTIGKDSSLAQALAVFEYNISQHTDKVVGCWYDSGDYLIFIQRNTQALFYLSLAYQKSTNIKAKDDLYQVIIKQLTCVEKMIGQNIKQFRDQTNHGLNLPPNWNKLLYPNNTYYFSEDEGKDVFLMLSLIYKNLGDSQKSNYYQQLSKTRNSATVSSNCCEYGPLQLATEELLALQSLANSNKNFQPVNTWGVHFEALAALNSGNIQAVKGVLTFLQNNFQSNGRPFNYLGGNYDIAGTIALERLYALSTKDQSFQELSDRLWAYLHGQNTYAFNFTQAPYIYHPCYFFKACKLPDTLINGFDDGHDRSPKSWQISEVQLVGQAQYILAKVLYNQN